MDMSSESQNREHNHQTFQHDNRILDRPFLRPVGAALPTTAEEQEQPQMDLIPSLRAELEARQPKTYPSEQWAVEQEQMCLQELAENMA